MRELFYSRITNLALLIIKTRLFPLTSTLKQGWKSRYKIVISCAKNRANRDFRADFVNDTTNDTIKPPMILIYQ